MRPHSRVEAGANNAFDRLAAFNDFRKVDRAILRGSGDHLFSQGRLAVRVQFINVEAVCFPIFMKAKTEVELRLIVEPGDMGAGLRRPGVKILAVEIETVIVFARVQNETSGVETRQ